MIVLLIVRMRNAAKMRPSPRIIAQMARMRIKVAKASADAPIMMMPKMTLSRPNKKLYSDHSRPAPSITSRPANIRVKPLNTAEKPISVPTNEAETKPETSGCDCFSSFLPVTYEFFGSGLIFYFHAFRSQRDITSMTNANGTKM